MVNLPVAQEIVLHKTKPLAPPFHQHIVKSKIQRQIVKTGDVIVVYEVTSTVPEGKVIVNENTVIRFT